MPSAEETEIRDSGAENLDAGNGEGSTDRPVDSADDMNKLQETVVQKDTIEVPLQLVPRFGFLKFSVENGVRISLADRSREFENYQTYELSRGEHSIMLQRPRYQSLQRTITIGSGDTLLVNPRLVPDFAYFDLTAIREGKVSIESDRAIGIYETKRGDHVLTLVHPEVGKLSKRFSVAPGATKKLNISDDSTHYHSLPCRQGQPLEIPL